MKIFTNIALATAIAAITALAGCGVAPARGDYRDRDHSYDHRYQDRDHYYRRNDEGRMQDGDHAGGTGTPD